MTNRYREMALKEAGITVQKGADGRTYHFDKNGQPVCAARTKRGTPCSHRPMKGKSLCKIHGGAALDYRLRGMNNSHLELSEDMHYMAGMFAHVESPSLEKAIEQRRMLYPDIGEGEMRRFIMGFQSGQIDDALQLLKMHIKNPLLPDTDREAIINDLTSFVVNHIKE